MLSIQPSRPQATIPHLLPARISHNGRVNSTLQYFTPSTDEKGTQHVHFRGRHLHGTPIPLPSTHTGAIVRVSDKSLPPQKPQSTSHRSSHQHSRQHQSLEEDDEQDISGDEEDEGEIDAEEVKIAEQIGTFDEIIIWEHGGVVDKERDGYVRGLEEWVQWAGCMHGDEDEEEEGKDGEGKK